MTDKAMNRRAALGAVGGILTTIAVGPSGASAADGGKSDKRKVSERVVPVPLVGAKEAPRLTTFVLEKLKDNGPQRGGGQIHTFNEVTIRTSADATPLSGLVCVNGQREAVVSLKDDLLRRRQGHTARLVVEKVRGEPADAVYSGDEVRIRLSLDCEEWAGYLSANPTTGALHFAKLAVVGTPTVWVIEKEGGGIIEEGNEVVIRTSADTPCWAGSFDITAERKLRTAKSAPAAWLHCEVSYTWYGFHYHSECRVWVTDAKDGGNPLKVAKLTAKLQHRNKSGTNQFTYPDATSEGQNCSETTATFNFWGFPAVSQQDVIGNGWMIDAKYGDLSVSAAT